MRLLAFGTYDARLHPRVQVLLEGLRAHDDEVIELNVPLHLDTAARVAMLQHPWRVPLLAIKLLSCWLRLLIRGRRSARRDKPDAVIVGYMGQFDIHLARLLFDKTPVALDQLVFAADTARDRGISTGWKTRLLERLDRSAIGRADVVAVDTPEHQDLAFEHHAERAVVAPVGATRSWFAAADNRKPLDHDGPLRIVFFGVFTPLQGTPIIGKALKLLADSTHLHVLMVGHGQDYASTRSLVGDAPFVQWRDWVPHDELPDLVSSYDVALGIFSDRPKALHVVPNKVYQGAAAGCALITSDTSPQRRILNNAALFVPPGDAIALADAIRGLAGDRSQVEKLQQAARRVADTTFRPDIVAQPLRECLQSLNSRKRHTVSDH